MIDTDRIGCAAFRFFAAEMNERVVQFLALENDLRKALAQDEFSLQYQPIVRIATGAALVQTVRDALEHAKVDPGLIRLELTESAVMHDPRESEGKLAELKALGVKLAVDDFGTGYSSLAYLKRFPIDVLKIDRAFVRDLETNEDDRELSRAIVDMGRALGLDVVAEGVETIEQARLLAATGCEFAQGYLYGEPVNPGNFELPERRGARS